jgi:hypothetical protein
VLLDYAEKIHKELVSHEGKGVLWSVEELVALFDEGVET